VTTAAAPATLPPLFADWFASRGWSPRRHQLEMVAAGEAGHHALLVAPTGGGKTLAGFLPSLIDLAERGPKPTTGPGSGVHTLYLSPLKALTTDVERNLMTPIREIGLNIHVETRTGDTKQSKRQRQRDFPPDILLTTPEQLALFCAWEGARSYFADLKCVVLDEVHAIWSGKRGDLLSLGLGRLQSFAPDMRRVGLSATIEDPDLIRGWLSPSPRVKDVTLVRGDPGAPAVIEVLISEGKVPWAGHTGQHAIPEVYAAIQRSTLALIFVNTRWQSEFVFQQLWAINDENLPIGLHHGSLAAEQRRKIEAAMARGDLRAVVCTSTLDLGIDWGDVDLVIQMAAPKGSSRLLQRLGRSNHRLEEASQGILVPGNRFEYLEARAALDAVEAGELDPDIFRPGALDVLAQHVMALACAAPFDQGALLDEIRSALPYSALDDETFDRVLHFISDGGYSLKAYDRFKRLTQAPDGLWRVSHPKFVAQHRLNAGIIVEATMLNVRFKNGRHLGKVEEGFAAQLSPGDTFFFAGLSCEVQSIDTEDLIVRASSKPARIPTYGGSRMPLSTNLATRVRHFLAEPEQWHRFPPDVRDWLEFQAKRSALPRPGQLLVETFPREGRHYMVAYSFEGWNAHQSLGMLVTRRMEAEGLKPLGFVANDYALACYGLEKITDPAALFSPDILEHEFVDWVQQSHLLKRAFREVAVIGGLVERQHPGKRKTGRQVTFSTDLIYDVLRKYEPTHLLLQAAWDDARARMTDVGRLAHLLDRAADTMLHVDLDRITPLAVPVLTLIGREKVSTGSADDALLIEAEALAAEAMRID